MDVYEVLRLIRLQKSDRAIAAALTINRKTVGKYRAWAASQGLLAQRELPSREELHRFLEGLPLPADAKARLLALTPSNYIGLAATLARES